MGFSGGFLDDSKAYFVPSHNSGGQGAKLVRVAASNFTSENVEVTNHEGSYSVMPSAESGVHVFGE